MNHTLANIAVAASAVFLTVKFLQVWARAAKLDGIPTVGATGFLSSFGGSLKTFKHAREIIQEGYEKYQGQLFKIPMYDYWQVIVTSPQLLDELRKAPDDVLSFPDATNASLQIEHTFGPEIHYDPYHTTVIKGALTRNIGNKFPEVRDEIAEAFSDEVPLTDDWSSHVLMGKVMRVVARATNRLFVGLPLCRNEEWMDINIRFTIEVVIAARIINLFPQFMKPLVGKMMTPVHKSIKRAMVHLGPNIEERLKKEEEYGRDYPDRPNDFVSWLMDEARTPQHRQTRDTVLRVLSTNFAAIHTTTIAFTNAMFYLAAYPQYVPELRQEVEGIVNEHGWSKASMQKLRKLDSFLKETARDFTLGCVALNRMALKDFTFSDGTTIPKGTLVGAASWAIHHDEKYYTDPHSFVPFRFADMREDDGESIKHQMIAPTTEYMFFGTGRHACPGRFFAVNELKALMSHVLLNYDVKLETEGVVPECDWFGLGNSPSRTAEVMFRKRKV
ncbi:cytochrome p450 [Moniliophthora roreri MCA 2997]|uniref:Cytochrome p450 n=1 Tax=Moniliophthora roreri (strain MCA 2997) TaxID=1381753 RepID=V2Y1D8_MONRO|nr:cytochrome p450 [Moniliophthora roreri MCA 2997]